MLLSIIAICLTGCFSSNPEDIQAFLMPDKVDVTAVNYLLQPPDEIEIRCSKVPEINGQRQWIRPDGVISFENFGEIQAAGRTPAQLANIIRGKALELYKLENDKPIDVQVIAYRSKAYYVLGQVLRPGAKIFTGRDTVLTAIANAHLNPMAWKERIQVIRPSNDENVKAKIFEVNFNRMQIHGDTSKNILLQEGDIVYVPPTILASLALRVEEVIRPIARAFAGMNVIETGGDRRGGYGY
jgi:polysaccharide export outer membrane protein